jgi:uncharacterized protein (TIGR03437 family)
MKCAIFVRCGVATLAVCAASLLCQAQGIITTVAGNGSGAYSGDGGQATSAGLVPYGVAVDQAGNLYIADMVNAMVRKRDTSGVISRIAGCNPANLSPCIQAGLSDGLSATGVIVFVGNPITVDSSGNIYVADIGHSLVRKVTPAGIISTAAGNGTQGYGGDNGPAIKASLNGPGGLAVDSAGNLYISDTLNNRVRKVDTTGAITTIAGDGTFAFKGEGVQGTSAELSWPGFLAFDSVGNLFIDDNLNYRVRKLTPAGIITTVAGTGNPLSSGDGGQAIAAGVAPSGVAVDGAGNIYISQSNSTIRKVDTTGKISTIAGGLNTGGFSGDNGPSANASLLGPMGLAVDAGGNLYIADSGNNRVRRIAAAPVAPSFVCTNTAPVTITSIDSASAYGGYSYFASGSWLEIKGTNLADPTDPRLNNSTHSGQWASSDFNGNNAPTNLDGISVSINGKPAYVWYISPTQINVQAPEDSTIGDIAITVSNCKATSSEVMFSRRALAPGLLAPSNYSSGGTQYLVATFQSDGAYVLNTSVGAALGLNSRPAKPGDGIIAYGIGFGDVIPSVLPGVITQESNAVSNFVSFLFNTIAADTSYAGLAGSFVGLYEFYITVPLGLTNGDYQIKVTQNGVALPQTMYLTVHN